MAAIANSSYSVFLNTTTKIECTLWIELNPKRQKTKFHEKYKSNPKSSFLYV